MPFQDQVVVIYAGTRGYLDKLAITDVGPFQDGLLAKVKSSHGGTLAKIAEKGALDEALDNELKSILTDYTSEFVASQ
eukprot:UN08279